MEQYVGKKIGKLLILKQVENSKNGHRRFLCKCDCGNEFIIFLLNLKRGTQKCSKCARKERKIKTHNKSHTRIYNVYCKMKQRCYNQNLPYYKNYGGRGIIICNEWLNKENGFMNFYNWAMNNGYKDNLTIDRINNDGNYEPQNCRWITLKEQASNRRSNRIIKYKNKEYTLTELSQKLNIKITTLEWRLNHNWKEDELSLESNFNNKYKRNKEGGIE